jgi:small subunit ribosomal protein S18
LVDYKEVDLLRKFMTASNKMMSRKRAGTNAVEQRQLRRAIKRARFMALLPYIGP